jgi:hypothetical protein
VVSKNTFVLPLISGFPFALKSKFQVTTDVMLCEHK